MKNVKLLSLLMALLMVLTLFAGCKSEEPAATKSADTEDAAAVETESKEEKEKETPEEPEDIVPLKFYIDSMPITDVERVMEKANEIINEEIGVQMELMPVEGLADRLNMMINSAEEWDISFGANWGGFNYFENAGSGAYYELTPENFNTYMPETYSRIPEQLWDGVKVNGKIYGTVNYQVWGVTLAKGISFIEKYAEDSGMDYENLVDQGFFAAAEELEKTYLPYIRDNFPDMVGFEAGINDVFAQNSLLFGYDAVGDTTYPGWVSLSDEGKPTVINQYETDEYKELLDVMRRWYNEGYVRKDAATVQDHMPDRQAGRIASLISQPVPFDVDEELMARKGVRVMPHAPQDSPKSVELRLVPGVIPAGKPSEAVLTIGANCKHPEKAMELIELLNTNDELYSLIIMGEEDVDWEFLDEDWLDDDGEVIMPAGSVKKVEGKYDFHWNDWQLAQSYSPTFTRGLLNDKNDKGEAEREIQRLHYKEDEISQASPVSGFTFDAEPVKTEIANCSAIIDEMLLALGTGSVDPDTKLPEFIQRLEAAGSETIIEEKQTQIDEWWAANH